MNILKVFLNVILIACVMIIMALVLKYVTSIWLIMAIVALIWLIGRSHNVIKSKLQILIGKLAAWIVKKFDVPISQ